MVKKGGSSLTQADVSRIQRAETKANEGRTRKGSWAAEAQSRLAKEGSGEPK